MKKDKIIYKIIKQFKKLRYYQVFFPFDNSRIIFNIFI